MRKSHTCPMKINPLLEMTKKRKQKKDWNTFNISNSSIVKGICFIKYSYEKARPKFSQKKSKPPPIH